MEIENFPNYLIYQDGRVWSKYSNRFLKLCINNVGYYSIHLYNNEEQKRFLIHRLIAIHYIENPDPNNFKIINHKNGDRLDNSIENIEWCDHLYNNQSKNTTRNIGCVYLTDCRKKPYKAEININRVRHRKYFKTEVEGRNWILTLIN